MPSKLQHLQIAQDNERLLRQLDDNNAPLRGWASTMAFYAAIHYVEAFFSLSKAHSADHRTRDGNLNSYPQTMCIYDEFCELKAISTRARYYGRYPTKEDLALQVIPALNAIQVEMAKHLH